MKRTFQPNVRRRKKTHGFRSPDGDQGGPQGAQASTREGAQTADGIAGRLPRRERLTSNSEFQTLFRHGQRIDRPLMVVLWRQTDSDPARRAGFTVSRQVRGAVARNRVKRRLREAYRATRDAAPLRASLVVIGRPAMLQRAHDHGDRRHAAGVSAAYREIDRDRPDDRVAPDVTLTTCSCAATRSLISPFLPQSCRFVPTCSEYAAEAITEHGLGRGAALADEAIAPLPSVPSRRV